MSYEILKQKLHECIALENTRSARDIAGFIVGEYIGDYENKYEDLEDNDINLQRIGELAGDLEISNGNEQELAAMWIQLKDRINAM